MASPPSDPSQSSRSLQPATLFTPNSSRSDPVRRISAHSLSTIHSALDDAPHHTLINSDSDSDRNDAVSIASSRPDQSQQHTRLVSKQAPETSASERVGIVKRQSSRDLESLPDDDHLDPPADDDDTGRQSLIGRDGFVDRRNTAGRIRRKSRGSLAQVWAISRETLPTLFLSLCSLVLSGELLIHLARWPVFLKVDKLFILVPILLNMKGNLEMNLSLRMSTSANIGELDIRRTRETLIRGNLALLQVQALIVSSFAGILAFVLGIITPDPDLNTPSKPTPVPSPALTPSPETAIVNRLVRSTISALRYRYQRTSLASVPGIESQFWPRRIIHHHPKPPGDPTLRLRNGYFEFVLIIATGMLSASLSSAALGSFMCALVVLTRRLGANPDNIASPIAASLGDLTTLTLLGLFASSLVHFEGTFLATMILAALVVACVCCLIVTYRNAYVRELLTSGWVPLLVAMFVSSGAGLVLDTYVQAFEGYALLAPVMSGLPGACAAIFASRITTALHSGKGASFIRSVTKASDLGGLRGLIASIHAVFMIPPIEGWLVPLTLLGIGTIIKILFITVAWLSGQLSFGWPFAITFVISSSITTCLALMLSHTVCLFLWSRDYDPDIYCLPFVSSTVDVLGQTLLVAAFKLAIFLGDHITAAVNVGSGHGGV